MVMTKKISVNPDIEEEINESFLQMTVKQHSKELPIILDRINSIFNRMIIIEKAVSDNIKNYNKLKTDVDFILKNLKTE
jgi:hypothetical protein